MSSKIIPLDKLLSNFSQKNTIILVTGVFDLLHSAHKKFLNLSKQLGGTLVVGVESDFRVRKLKGSGRPIETATIRAQHLADLDSVDYVFILPEDFAKEEVREKLINKLKPNIYAVSSHSPNLPQKIHLIEKYGGKVKVVMDKDDSISTTQILESYNN